MQSYCNNRNIGILPISTNLKTEKMNNGIAIIKCQCCNNPIDPEYFMSDSGVSFFCEKCAIINRERCFSYDEINSAITARGLFSNGTFYFSEQVVLPIKNHPGYAKIKNKHFDSFNTIRPAIRRYSLGNSPKLLFQKASDEFTPPGGFSDFFEWEIAFTVIKAEKYWLLTQHWRSYTSLDGISFDEKNLTNPGIAGTKSGWNA